MRIALVQSANDQYQRVVDLCLPNHKEYADKHGYDCLFRVDNDRPVFGRFYYAFEVLPHYDAIAIVDMDLVFLNQTQKLEDKLGTYDLVTGQDKNGMNCSIVIVRNSQWSFDFWEKYFKNKWDTLCADQTTLAYHLVTADKTKWHIPPQRVLFSYLSKRLYNRDCPQEEYQDGDFALTTPGTSFGDKMTVLGEYANKKNP
jgi:hypothetical protein